MKLIEFFLLFLAYTLGLTTLILQLICYRKKMESLETLLFSGAFLLLIIVLSIFGVEELLAPSTIAFFETTLDWVLILLGFTTALNIHTERQFRFPKTANQILYTVFALGAIILAILQVFENRETAALFASSLMGLSIAWSMLLVLFTRPSIVIQHRNHIERVTSWVFLGLVLLLVGLGLAQTYWPTSGITLPTGPYLVALFFIFLSAGKIWDDLHRLSLLSSPQQLNPHVMQNMGISAREQEVLSLLISGLSYQQIADQLFISLPTVKTHVSNIYRKAGVKNKVGLINLLNTLP